DEAKERAGAYVHEKKERLGESGRRGREQAGTWAHDARERVGRFTRERREHAGQYAHDVRVRAQSRARSSAERFSQTLEENPLAVGMIALALGTAAALLLPPSRREDELMGEARDDLMETARVAGRKTFASAREGMGEAFEDARASL